MMHVVTQVGAKHLTVLHKQVSALNLPGFSGVSFNGKDTVLEFPERSTPLNTAEAEAVANAVAATQVEVNGLVPLENRAAAYAAEVGSLEQQIDALYKVGVFPTDSEAYKMQQKRLEIKARYPKQ